MLSFSYLCTAISISCAEWEANLVSESRILNDVGNEEKYPKDPPAYVADDAVGVPFGRLSTYFKYINEKYSYFFCWAESSLSENFQADA